MRADFRGLYVSLKPGINELRSLEPRDGTAAVSEREPGSSGSVTHSFDLDIGEVALGHHLIARGISLTGDNLILEWAFVPEVAEEEHGDVWPNMHYDADVSPRGWNQGVSDWDVFERPVPEARYVWIDFFHPDFDWMVHFDGHGLPDGDYLRNRIARLTFDLKIGEAQLES